MPILDGMTGHFPLTGRKQPYVVDRGNPQRLPTPPLSASPSLSALPKIPASREASLTPSIEILDHAPETHTRPSERRRRRKREDSTSSIELLPNTSQVRPILDRAPVRLLPISQLSPLDPPSSRPAPSSAVPRLPPSSLTPRPITTGSSARPSSSTTLSSTTIPPTPSTSTDVKPFTSILPCEVTRIQDKGLGLRSTRPITKGDLILAEPPFISFPHPITSDDLWPRLAALSPEKRKLFRSFTGTVGEKDHDIDIAETNAINMFVEEDEEVEESEDEDEGVHGDREEGPPPMSGLFEHVSRANHSCAPNAGWRWDEASKTLRERLHFFTKPLFLLFADWSCLVLLAYMDIRCGAEITCSYINPTLPSSARHRELRAKFSFTCLCSACSRTPQKIKASDQRLEEYRRIDAMWADNRYIFDRLRAPLDFQTAIDILLGEKQVAALCHVYVERFRFYASWGDRFKAKNAAKTALEHLAVVVGREAAEREEIGRWVREPEAFEGWRSVYEQVVSVGWCVLSVD